MQQDEANHAELERAAQALLAVLSPQHSRAAGKAVPHPRQLEDISPEDNSELQGRAEEAGGEEKCHWPC